MQSETDSGLFRPAEEAAAISSMRLSPALVPAQTCPVRGVTSFTPSTTLPNPSKLMQSLAKAQFRVQLHFTSRYCRLYMPEYDSCCFLQMLFLRAVDFKILNHTHPPPAYRHGGEGHRDDFPAILLCLMQEAGQVFDNNP